MSKLIHIRAALFGTAALVVLAAQPALAQTAEQTTEEAATQPPAPEATGAADDEGQDTATGDIVVTARRTEENVQRVPTAGSKVWRASGWPTPRI